MTTALTKPETAVRPWFRRGPLTSLREEMAELLSQFWPEEGDGWGRMLPSIDVAETDQCLEVRMDVPGLKPADIDVQLSGGVLTVRGERKEEKEEKGKMFHRLERRVGSFSRSVTLPCSVKEDKVEAEYHDGVLTVTMQKTEEAKSRKIKVKC